MENCGAEKGFMVWCQHHLLFCPRSESRFTFYGVNWPHHGVIFQVSRLINQLPLTWPGLLWPRGLSNSTGAAVCFSWCFYENGETRGPIVFLSVLQYCFLVYFDSFAWKQSISIPFIGETWGWEVVTFGKCLWIVLDGFVRSWARS